MIWPHLRGRLTRRSSIFLILLAAVFVLATFWSANRINSGFKNNISIMLPLKDDSQPNDLARLPLETQLKMAVDKLPAKGIHSSPLMMEDLYFIPNEQPYEFYNHTVLKQPLACRGETLLVVLVPSNPASIQEREAIRETWGSVAWGHQWPGHMTTYDMRLFFVLGTLPNSTYDYAQSFIAPSSYRERNQSTIIARGDQLSEITTAQPFDERDEEIVSREYAEKVQEEAKIYDDIVQLDLVDSYTNLTRKLLIAFNWLLKSCHKSKFILKADQDVFVNVPLVLALISHYGHQHSIYGHVYPNSWVQRSGKWSVDKKTLPIDQYPVYVAGNAYIIASDAAETVLRIAPYFPNIPVEDAFITGILASVGQVDRIHVSGFTKWSDPLPDACQFASNDIYVGNNASVHDLRVIWWYLTIPNISGC